MKIVLSSWGTTGDVHPFLALAHTLLQVGHEVRMCTSEIYRERFTQIGVDFYSVGLPFEATRFHQVMDKIVTIRNPLKSATLVAQEGILKGAKQWYQDCLEGMGGYDLAICHSADMPGQEAAIRHRLPWVTVSYCPGFIKTAYEAPAPLPNLGLPFNVVFWKIAERLLRKRVDPLFNSFFISIGGEPRTLIGLKGMYSPELNLVAASPSICKPAPDLPEQHRFTGVWFWDERTTDIPLAVHDFLKQGPAPVIVSFGSMGGTNAVETTEILVEAVRDTGQRAIIQSGWGNLTLNQSFQDILFVGYLPHDFLFRQGVCVIHHGGAGTTASACRAGVPSIVIPHLADQSYWGNRLHKLGMASTILYRQNMTVKRLSKRIKAVIESKKSMKQKAEAVATKMSREDGPTRAVEFIEQFAIEKGIR